MTEQYTGEYTESTQYTLFVRTEWLSDGDYVSRSRQTVSVHGIDDLDGTVIQRTPATMVVKVPGRNWYNKGETYYTAAHFDVYTIHGVETDGVEDTINATRIVSFPVRKYPYS